MSAGFVGRLATVLLLRLHLRNRRLRARGRLQQLLGTLIPFVAVWIFVLVWGGTTAVAQTFGPSGVAILAMAILAATHLLVFFEVVARVGRGEGMAAALYHYPLSPALIHASETITGGLTPVLLLASTALLALGGFLGGSAFLGTAWMGLAVLYLFGLRQLLQLLLATLLRRRGLREAALALVSMAGVGMWLGWSWLSQHIQPQAVEAWLASAPQRLWLLPFAWFVTPAAQLPALAPGVGLVGLVGAPLLVAAVFVVGFELQDAACYGESPTLLPRRRSTRRRKRWHLLDRVPFSLVPPAVWSTAGKEVRVVRRDPFLVVMLLSQGAILLAPPFLLMGGDLEFGSSGLRGYLPFFVLLLLFAEHTPLFNLVGQEGRALRFLAQTPVSRWEVLVGKNLAYVGVFGLFNTGFLLLACWVFGAPDLFGVLWLLGAAGLITLLGLGNFVSAWLPMPWAGARRQAGGARSATAVADGGVERPGCGVLMLRLMLLQGLMVLLLPSVLAVGLCHFLLPPAGWWPTAAAVLAWSGLVYVVGSSLAVRRIEHAEDKLLVWLASRSAG